MGILESAGESSGKKAYREGDGPPAKPGSRQTAVCSPGVFVRALLGKQWVSEWVGKGKRE